MSKPAEVNVEGNAENIKRILKGSFIAIVITMILLFIFSIVLTYTSVNESVMPTVVIIISAISILIGSQISSSYIKKNGLINGGLVGLIYITLLYIISSLVTLNFSLNIYSIIMMILSVLAGSVGGIIGVNRR